MSEVICTTDWRGGRSRMNDTTVRVAVQSRVHEDDWSGHVLRTGDWEDLKLPTTMPATGRRRWKRGQKRNRRQRLEGRAESEAFRREVFTCTACKEEGEPHRFPRWLWRDIPGGGQECPIGRHPALLLHMRRDRQQMAAVRLRAMMQCRSLLRHMVICVGERTS